MAEVERIRVPKKIPIRIELEAVNSRVMEKFERAVSFHPIIEECYVLAGVCDYLLFITVSDIRDFEEIHRNVLSRLPGVRKIKADFPLRRVMPPN